MNGLIHFDTNYLIQYAGGKSDSLSEQVLQWIEQGYALHVSAMAWAEFRCGPLTEEDYDLISEIIAGVVPITKELANEAGHLFEVTGRRPRSLADCLIAATAIREKAPLATKNRADFEPFLTHKLILI